VLRARSLAYFSRSRVGNDSLSRSINAKARAWAVESREDRGSPEIQKAMSESELKTEKEKASEAAQER